jgi:2',3'-cyclic-nucleotide 2'-phosphodiesterase (5'-nucleotidase family)
VPYLAAGPLTRGELYELCPFDNLLLIVEVPGDILDTLLQQISAADGWPMSGDVRITIRDHVMSGCTINKQPIDRAAIYRVAMPDYVANGGDDMKMLIPLSRIQTGQLVRDILIDYAMETAKKGKTISAPIEGRIIIER